MCIFQICKVYFKIVKEFIPEIKIKIKCFDSRSMAEDDKFVKDGTVDYKNNPAIKKQTGTWRACPYILGTLLFSQF